MEKGTFQLKSGLAEMLKGGVIMDVTTPEQAKIAQEAGACAPSWRLSASPPDIRKARGRRPHGRSDHRPPHHGRRDHPGHGQGAHRPHRRSPYPRIPRASTTSTKAKC